MISNTQSTNTLRLAKVTHVHPEGQKLEVLFLDNGDYGRDVQVMSPYAGTDFGFTGGIPAPEEEGHEPNRRTDPNKRDIIAVIANLQGRHLCLGYLYPQVTHMAFTKDSDKNRMIERHTSDWYRTVDDEGNMDMVHPALAVAFPTTFIRMGVGPIPAVLTGRDYDGRWALKRNLFMPAMITIAAPAGVLIAGGDETIELGGAASFAASGAASSAPAGGAMLMSAEEPVDWIAAAALADAPAECVDENENNICDDLERLRERYTVVLRMGSGGCFVRSKRHSIDIAVDELKPAFVFRTKTGTFSISDDRISAYIGGSSGINIEKDRITLQVGNTKLELTADGITTTGNMTTEGVHTDANGVHAS
jgi:hypothetical protein